MNRIMWGLIALVWFSMGIWQIFVGHVAGFAVLDFCVAAFYAALVWLWPEP